MAQKQWAVPSMQSQCMWIMPIPHELAWVESLAPAPHGEKNGALHGSAMTSLDRLDGRHVGSGRWAVS
jgi:hypothetical protein